MKELSSKELTLIAGGYSDLDFSRLNPLYMVADFGYNLGRYVATRPVFDNCKSYEFNKEVTKGAVSGFTLGAASGGGALGGAALGGLGMGASYLATCWW